MHIWKNSDRGIFWHFRKWPRYIKWSIKQGLKVTNMNLLRSLTLRKETHLGANDVVSWCLWLLSPIESYLLVPTLVLYMWSSICLLGVESRDFSHAEKERFAWKVVQIHKMTTVFTQNDSLGPFWVNIVVIFWICSSLQGGLSFSAWHDTVLQWQNSGQADNWRLEGGWQKMLWPASV